MHHGQQQNEFASWAGCVTARSCIPRGLVVLVGLRAGHARPEGVALAGTVEDATDEGAGGLTAFHDQSTIQTEEYLAARCIRLQTGAKQSGASPGAFWSSNQARTMRCETYIGSSAP